MRQRLSLVYEDYSAFLGVFQIMALDVFLALHNI